MHKYIAILLLCLSMMSFGTPSFADFQKGLDAYNNGDFATALRELKPLAEQGDAEAQLYLGSIYSQGDRPRMIWHHTSDPNEAAKWYKLSAEQGHAQAQYALGVTYLLGRGVIKDYKEAVKWFKLSAEQGHAGAQSTLGTCYQYGTGVIQDNARAHMWYNIAASQGDEAGIESRNTVVKDMTPADISKAQDMARECVANEYKGC